VYDSIQIGLRNCFGRRKGKESEIQKQTTPANNDNQDNSVKTSISFSSEGGETVGGKAVGNEAGTALVAAAVRVTAGYIEAAGSAGVAGSAYGPQSARKTIARRGVVLLMIMGTLIECPTRAQAAFIPA
jgi:hypothetical protein